MNAGIQKIIYMLIIMIFFLTPLSKGGSLQENDRVFTQNGVLSENWTPTDKVETKEAVTVNSTAAAGNMPYISEQKSLPHTKETLKDITP